MLKWWAGVVLCLGVVLAAATPAWAGDEGPAVAPDDCAAGGFSYGCTDTDPGQEGEDPGPGDNTGPAEPTCALLPGYTYCKGTVACRSKEGHPPYIAPEGDKPNKDSTWMIEECANGDFRAYWSDEEEPQTPSIEEQMRTAVGQLNLDLPPLRTSPTNRTLVNLPTWFWVEGGEGAQEQTGSSAFGLVAIATVRGLSIDTGDGETVTCPWVTSAQQAEQECSYVYSHASHDGPYEVAARSTWDIRFEMNGNPVEIPGAPGTLPGPPSTATLQVDEVQSTVEEVR